MNLLFAFALLTRRFADPCRHLKVPGLTGQGPVTNIIGIDFSEPVYSYLPPAYDNPADQISPPLPSQIESGDCAFGMDTKEEPKS
jgi:hypothetical protein